MWNKFGVVLLAGFQAGSLIGVFEAVQLLLAVGAGEYDALLWGGVLYGVLGLCASSVCWLPLWKMQTESKFALSFSLSGAVLGWWTFGSVWWLGAVVILPWLTSVMVRRTPLRMLIQPKGASVGLVLWLVLLSIFSLTPSRTVYSPPVHQNSAVGKANILWIVIDQLRSEILHTGQTPALGALYKRSIVFENAFSDGSSPFQTLASALSGQPISTPPPLPSHLSTLPEKLAYEGYQTIAMVTDREFGRFSNMHEGFDRFRYLPPKLSSTNIHFGFRNEGTQHLKIMQLMARWFPSEPRSVQEVIQIFTRELVTLDTIGTPWFAVLQIGDGAARIEELDKQLGHLLNNLSGQQAPIVVLTGNLGPQWQSDVFDPQIPLWIQVQPSAHRVVRNPVTISALPHTLLSILGVVSDPSWKHTNMIRLPPQNRHKPTKFQHYTPNGRIDWIQDDGWRFIRQEGREHLYNIIEDPHMEHNVMGHFPEQHQKMLNVLNEE